MSQSLAGSSGHARLWRTTISLSVALAVVLAFAPIASATILTNAWMAKIGSAGANGSATLNFPLTGSGSIVLKLAKLKVVTSLAVTLSKGSCGSVGSTLIKFPAIKTTSRGAAARTTSLTAAQVTLVKKATAGTAKIAIRIGTGSSAKCGLFAAQAVAPYVASSITVGRLPSAVAIDPSGVWVTNWLDKTLTKIDPTTNTPLSVLPLALPGLAGPWWIASGAGSLWITTVEFDLAGSTLPGSVLRLDPATGSVLATIAVGKGAADIVVGFGSVWVPNRDDNTVVRIDPGTNQAVASIPVSGGPGAIAADASGVWVVSEDGTVYRLDPVTNQVAATIQTQTTGAAIGVGNGAVWVTNPGTKGQADGTLTRIDPATNKVVASTPLGRYPGDLAVAGGSVWVGMFDESTVVRVSATTNAVLSRIAVRAPVAGIEANANTVWAVHAPAPNDPSLPPPGTVTRINYGIFAPPPPPTPAATPTPTPVPTPTPPAGGTLVIGPYFFVAIPAGWRDTTVGDALQFHGPGVYQAIGTDTTTQSGLTLEAATAQIIQNIKSKSGGAEPEQNEAITLGGEPGRLLTYHFVTQGLNAYELEAHCVHNGRGYEITFANVAGTESADRTLFLSILATFTFLSAG